MKSKALQTERVIVGLSGGVDSAVAAATLIEAGFDVHAATLRLWQVDPTRADSALERVRAIAETLHIPLRVLDLRERFYREIVEPFAETYARGLTPNPCVLCNPHLKFNALLSVADEEDARWVATGHYARVRHPPQTPAQLWQARSRRRDQSYMLYRLTQTTLTRLRLPLGEMEAKTEVRAQARRLGLPVADTQDSQDLCFLAGGDYRSLVETLRPSSFEPGPIVNEAGEVLGTHRGLPRYTVGQRSGLGLASEGRLYVLALRPAENTLVVGPAERLQKRGCLLRDVTFIAGEPPAHEFTAEVRIRYRAPLTKAYLEILPAATAHVTFATPQRAPAPGQSVVFYQGEQVLGGGLITRSEEDT
ncbi:MAG: tRNA 2-thiouridine(34) synthase MnmA [Anaerolineae bacterium]